jgi:hypothetical protein
MGATREASVDVALPEWVRNKAADSQFMLECCVLLSRREHAPTNLLVGCLGRSVLGVDQEVIAVKMSFF